MTIWPSPRTSVNSRLLSPAVSGAVLILYLAIISVDGVRKVAGLPSAVVGITYVITGVIYLLICLGTPDRGKAGPRSLPVWLIMLSIWCLAEAASQDVPAGIALLGWVSYVFFVPLFYVGRDLMADDHRAARVLRVVAIAASIVGLGAIFGAFLGQSAPTLIAPITPAVGIHNSNNGNIFLAPSVFADAEEAAEQLLIGLFAWAALIHLPSGSLKRAPSAIIGVIIIGGLVAAERRADIYVAIAGIIALVALNRISSQRTGQLQRQRLSQSRGRLGTPLLAAALGAIFLVIQLGASRLTSFLTTTGSATSRISVMFGMPNPGLTGQGTGTSTQGGVLVGAASSSSVTTSQGTYPGYLMDGRAFRIVEGGLAKTSVELGLVGVLLYGGVFLSILIPLVRSLVRTDGVGRALTILTVAIGIIFLKGHQSLDDPLVQPLFWLAAGGAWGRIRSVDQKQSGASEIDRKTEMRAIPSPGSHRIAAKNAQAG